MTAVLEPCDQAGRCTGYCGGPCPGEEADRSRTETRDCGICQAPVTVTITITGDGVTWTSYSCGACGSTWAMADAGMIDLGLAPDGLPWPTTAFYDIPYICDGGVLDLGLDR
jgi:hypothetical protein